MTPNTTVSRETLINAVVDALNASHTTKNGTLFGSCGLAAGIMPDGRLLLTHPREDDLGEPCEDFTKADFYDAIFDAEALADHLHAAVAEWFAAQHATLHEVADYCQSLEEAIMAAGLTSEVMKHLHAQPADPKREGGGE